MAMILRVGVNGAAGRMGKVTSCSILSQDDLHLAFTADRGDDLERAILETEADVVVDFTVPEAVFRNTMTIIEAGARPVVGTTGLNAEELDAIDAALIERNLGGIAAPNFSLGALLMMKLAEEAARHMQACEIVELHHEGKIDSPSGTSLLTAERLAGKIAPRPGDSAPSRGLAKGDVRIHSLRLPGQMAHQQVVFGGPGESLTVTHNAISRECFVPGILKAIREVLSLKGLQREMRI
jgi:4-hydroxy-tetrahydrodipicolinate reductase